MLGQSLMQVGEPTASAETGDGGVVPLLGQAQMPVGEATASSELEVLLRIEKKVDEVHRIIVEKEILNTQAARNKLETRRIQKSLWVNKKRTFDRNAQKAKAHEVLKNTEEEEDE